ncbi:uncharacterized protein LOC143361551 [Halictus rubicundus]|uniref:uncharacterized protein LOC143361551 n=1 Tax=Halictus rubicundus TaxID=77578 RepID=UPI00403668F9
MHTGKPKCLLLFYDRQVVTDYLGRRELQNIETCVLDGTVHTCTARIGTDRQRYPEELRCFSRVRKARVTVFVVTLYRHHITELMDYSSARSEHFIEKNFQGSSFQWKRVT